MSGAATHGPMPAARGPHIEITPSAAEYEQLCRDLAALRKAGAETNTAAVVDAVHKAAKQRYPKRVKKTPGKRRKRPPGPEDSRSSGTTRQQG